MISSKAAAVEAEAAGRGGLSQSELDELVASSDTGGRAADGPIGKFILLVALAWSLFQLWFASPFPFMVGFGVFNDTEARSIHLAFAIFLAFAAFPGRPQQVPAWAWSDHSYHSGCSIHDRGQGWHRDLVDSGCCRCRRCCDHSGVA